MGFLNKLLYRKRLAEKPLTREPGPGESFQNHYEYDAEYILIPGGRYKYQAKTKKKVPNVYFAKYPVTKNDTGALFAILKARSGSFGKSYRRESLTGE